jgi:hypothetical protein
MATTRIKDLSKTATTVASDANIVIDGSSNGTQKIARDNFRQDTADAYVAAPSTYKLTPLNGVNKIDAAYLPTSGDTPKGEWNASTNSPTLADGTGTAGDYYDVTTAGTANLGSGAITYTVGDVVKYNGATWFKIDSVANILDGSATAEQGRTTLDVNSIAQDAESTGTKLVGPSMYFDGSAFVTITSDSKLSFEGSGNDLPFTFSCWTKLPASSPAGTVFFSKWVSAAEYSFQTTSAGNLILYLSDGSNTPFVKASTALPTEQWVHVCGTYSGTSGGGYSSAANGLTLYVDGEAVTATQTNKPAYSGMTAGSDALQISRIATTNYEQTMRDARIFNKELSASEVKTLCLSGSVPDAFAESVGGADGGIYNSDFSAGTDGWTAFSGATVTGNIDGIGGKDNNLRLMPDTSSGSHRMYKTGLPSSKRVKLTFDYYIPSSNSNIDGFYTLLGANGPNKAEATATLDAWTSHTHEGIVDSGNNSIYFYSTDGGSATYQDSGGNDVLYIRDVRVTQIGSVLDAPAEQFDTSTGKLYDLSGNDFVGTQSGGVSVLGRQSPIYETGTWTVGLEFGGTALAVASQTGTWTRIGDLVHVAGAFNLSSIAGIGSGNARITGLPFTAEAQTSRHGITFVLTVGMTGLTSAVVGNVLGGDTDIAIYQWGSTGTASLTNANFTASTYSRFSGFYQIS